MPGILDKERIIAGTGFDRWLVPPRRTGHSFMHRNSLRFFSFLVAAFKSAGHHQRGQMRSRGWVFRRNFQLDLRLEDIHPRLDVHLVFRVAGFIRCDLGRLARTRWPAQSWRGVSRMLVRRHVDFCAGHPSASVLVMLLGSGVIGGIGLGLGYISPVSTLIKWLPDRRGMATGIAIMGLAVAR